MVNRFSGTASSVAEGDTLTIEFCNPALAGQAVEITIVGDQPPDQKVVIQLDQSGCGSAGFDHPEGWSTFSLEHPSSDFHPVNIIAAS